MSVIPIWVKGLILVGVLGGIVSFGWYIKGIKDDNVELRSQQSAMLERIDKAEKANTRQDQAIALRDTQQNDVRSGVADVTVRIKQEAANDPITHSFLTTRLPNGLRNAILKKATTGTSAEHQGADSAHDH